MDRFPQPLRAELQPDRKTWRLLAPFSYLDPDHGLIEAEEGFETDFASVKSVRTIGVILLVAGLVTLFLSSCLGALLMSLGFGVLLLYAAVVGYGQEAAVIHDWLYQTGQLPRAPSDRVYFNAQRSSGIARWRAWLTWAGVRIGGMSRYQH